MERIKVRLQFHTEGGGSSGDLETTLNLVQGVPQVIVEDDQREFQGTGRDLPSAILHWMYSRWAFMAKLREWHHSNNPKK